MEIYSYPSGQTTKDNSPGGMIQISKRSAASKVFFENKTKLIQSASNSPSHNRTQLCPIEENPKSSLDYDFLRHSRLLNHSAGNIRLGIRLCSPYILKLKPKKLSQQNPSPGPKVPEDLDCLIKTSQSVEVLAESLQKHLLQSVTCHKYIQEIWEEVETTSKRNSQVAGRSLSAKEKYLPMQMVNNNITLTEQEYSYFAELFNYGTQPQIEKVCLTASKEDSIKIQIFLEAATEEVILKIFSVMKPKLHFYFSHPRGTYLLQKLLQLNSEIKASIYEFAATNFWRLVPLEYSSKTLQRMATESDPFREYCLQQYRSQSPIKYTEQMPSVFLLCSLIRLSSRPSEYQFIVEQGCSKKQLWSNRRFKRILVTYIEFCPAHRLEEVFANFQSLQKELSKSLNEKYLGYVFLAFLNRGFQGAFSLLLAELSSKPTELLSSRMFGMILLRYIRDCGKVQRQHLFEKLTQKKIARKIVRKKIPDQQLFYFYIILKFVEFSGHSLKLMAMEASILSHLLLEVSKILSLPLEAKKILPADRRYL